MPTSKPEFFGRLFNLDNEPGGDVKELSNAEFVSRQGRRATRANSVSRTMPAPVVPENASNPPPEKKRKSRALKTSTKPPGKGKKDEPRAAKVVAGPSRKRKKELPLQMMPESQQIFKGLHFYFLPNDDISPARRMRIRKAMEHGAAWVKEWTDDISHIIADKYLTYQDIIKYLKISSLPDNVVLVNEIYPIDCARDRLIINPSHPYYQVDGSGSGQRGYVAPSATQSLQGSEGRALSPKPTKRKAGPQETPPRKAGFGGLDLVRQLPKAPLLQLSAQSQFVHQKINDALDEAIKEARGFSHLPISTDEEDETVAQSPVDHDTDDEEAENPFKKLKSGTGTKNNSFQCMHKNDGCDSETNPNAKTISVLQEMSGYYTRTQDLWRSIAYRRAIATLRKQDHKIMTAEEAARLPFIGSRLALKIEEIVCTNRLRRLESTKLEQSDKLLEIFLGIYGVGFAQASRWINQGYRTFEDLLTRAQLTKNQRIGIEHYEDFNTRIPRIEVEEHGEIVSSTAHSIDPQLQVVIMGSYRRGAETCGDIDFMITKSGATIRELRNILLDELIPSLFTQDFLQAGLAVASKTDGTKWHGASRLPGRDGAKWRRVDFLLVPTEEMGAALIYFTGNDIFNRSIRLLAGKKGMRLNQHGLWKDVIRGRSRERMTQGTLLEGKSEKRIFQLLGVPYRPPEHRNC